MADFIRTILDFLTVELTVLFTAMLPVIELRGAIPVGLSLGLSSLHTFVLSYVGSCIPIPFIIYFIKPIFRYLRKNTKLKNLVDRITEKNEKKKTRIKKYGALGLFLFVAIPLPGTGIWSGSLAAALLNLDTKKSMLIISLGNLVAGFLVMSLSHGFVNMIT